MSADLCGIDRQASVDSLARTIWYARAVVFNLDVPHWEALDVELRRCYIAHAQQCLDGLKPAPTPDPLFNLTLGLSRTEAARVVGRIGPEAPWGVDDSQGRD